MSDARTQLPQRELAQVEPIRQDAAKLLFANGWNWPTAGTPVGEVDATLLTFKPMS